MVAGLCFNQPMETDVRGISLTTVDGRGVDALIAKPNGDGPWPAIVVIHEIWGADDEMYKHLRHLASLGYIAVMPNLYSDGGMRKCLIGTLKSLRSGRGRAYADIEASRQHLLSDDDCTGTVGVLGFCMGGGFALMTASGFSAAAVNYGDLPKAMDSTLGRACPIVGSYGRKDVLNKGAAPRLEATLSRLDIPHDVKEYPNAGHAFMNEELNGWPWTRPIVRALNFGPDPVAARDAWARIEAFFAAHLVTGKDTRTATE